MELSINLSHFFSRRAGKPDRTFDEVLPLVANAGFSYLDYTPNYRRPDFVDNAKRESEMLNACHVQVEQGHAPFNRYRTMPVDEFPTLFHRSFVTAAAVGAKYMVIHADEYHVTDHYDAKEIIEFAYDYIAPELEYAKKFGMKIAIENLFEDVPKGCQMIDGKCRFTSRVEEVIAMIERFNDPDVVCCWDFGHGAVSYGYEKNLDALRAVEKYLHCTHVHDNMFGKDAHLMPFTGKINWEANMKLLREMNYTDKLSFELVYDRMTDEILPSWLSFAKSVGDTLNTLANE